MKQVFINKSSIDDNIASLLASEISEGNFNSSRNTFIKSLLVTSIQCLENLCFLNELNNE